MKAFKLRLELGLSSGAALALLSIPACGGSSSVDGGRGGSGSAGTAGSGAAGTPASAGSSAAGAAGESNPTLDPYPVNALGCTGPAFDGGYYGQCCAEALCYSPAGGEDCVAADDAPEKLGTFYGSGSCLCGEGVEGPFAANPTHQPEKPGTCCYVISSITCEGRPLFVDGAAILSALMLRCDWIVSDLLELSV